MASASVGGEGLGFGLVFSIIDEASSVARQIGAEFQRLTNGADRMSQGVNGSLNNTNNGFAQFSNSAESMSSRVQSSLNRIYEGVAQAGAGIAMLMPMKSAIDAFSEFDSLQRGMLAVMKNDINAVNSEMTRLDVVAKLPGLGLQEAYKGSISLQSVGMSADMARDSLRGFANAVATVGGGRVELDGVVLQLRQMMSLGKVLGADLRPIMSRIPQLGTIMQKVFGTASAEGINKLGISAKEFVSKITAELLKLPQMTGGIKNGIENLTDQFWKTKVAIGEALAPAFEYLGDKVQGLLESIERFAGTSFGKVTIQVLGLITTFLASILIIKGVTTALGGVISMLGGLKMIFTSFLSINPIVLALVAITAGITLAYKAWSSFGDLMDSKTDSMKMSFGVLQRFGGYLQAIGEILSTVTSGGWSMSKAMEDMLQRMGILDNVIAFGTWIVRLRVLAEGFISVLVTVGGYISSAFDSALRVLNTLGLSFDRNLSSLKKWKIAGQIIGVVLVAAITLLAGSMIAAGVAAAIAWAPFIIIGGLIIYLGKTIYESFGEIKNMFYSISDAISNFASKAVEVFGWLWDNIPNFGSMAFNAGKTFVLNLWEGIKSVWNDLVNWIKNAWSNVTGIFGKELSVTNNATTTPAESFSGVTQNTNFLDKNMGYRTIANNAPAAAAYSMQPQYIDRSTETVRNVQNVITLDGRVIHQSVNEASSMDAALGGF